MAQSARSLMLSCALAAALAPLTVAHPAPAPRDDVRVRDVWARATPAAARMGAIYLTLESAAGDRLVGAEVPAAVAAHTQIHETVAVADSNGAGGERMAMRQVEAIALPPGAVVHLAPGGFHIMLLDLKKPLKAGARVPVTLRFEKAGKVTVLAAVRVG